LLVILTFMLVRHQIYGNSYGLLAKNRIFYPFITFLKKYCQYLDAYFSKLC
jgi:hypothetical protein